MGGPVLLAAFSPYLAFRQPVYIAAGFAGIIAMALLVIHPLLPARVMAGLGRAAHRALGPALLVLIGIHVGGLWITSPPDVIDALTFRSPAPFSVWGVIAMWAALAAGAIALVRRGLAPRTWRAMHVGLGMVIASGTAAHALLIDGAMEPVSKAALAAAILLSALWAARRSMRFSR